MISIVRQFSNDIALPHAYLISGEVITFSEPVLSLSAFAIEYSKANFLSSGDSLIKKIEVFSSLESLTEHNSRLTYLGQAQFDQQMRRVHYWRSGDVAQIDIDGVPSCRINLSFKSIVILNELPFDAPFNLELITGPALILLLTQRSIFCLHAGAVSLTSVGGERINVAFLADSGVGKSTLSKNNGQSWMQLCDDILPVRIDQSTVTLFNDFPQLKLEKARVKSRDLKSNDLDFVVCLASNESEEIFINKMPSVQSVLAVVRHTVASRLFDKDLLRQHCEFAQIFVQKVPILQASYPRDINQLGELQSRIVETVS